MLLYVEPLWSAGLGGQGLKIILFAGSSAPVSAVLPVKHFVSHFAPIPLLSAVIPLMIHRCRHVYSNFNIYTYIFVGHGDISLQHKGKFLSFKLVNKNLFTEHFDYEDWEKRPPWDAMSIMCLFKYQVIFSVGTNHRKFMEKKLFFMRQRLYFVNQQIY